MGADGDAHCIPRKAKSMTKCINCVHCHEDATYGHDFFYCSLNDRQGKRPCKNFLTMDEIRKTLKEGKK